ncbi:MAG: guanylate kinase [Deltaproteobacteria bacterium]|jgi:guanylate kinase|nr:guanylate kinase [Deltaproteobacteria bacterium]
MNNDNDNIDFKNESLHGDGKPKGLIFAVSAPSGTGKTTLCSMLLKEFKDIKSSVSFTTRAQREGEIDGVSYHFISDAEFDKMIGSDEFIEWANVFGKKYGTAYKSVYNSDSLCDILLEIDVQGVEKLNKIYKNKKGAALKNSTLITIFITPPSYEVLKERLKKRGGLSGDELNKRLATAYEEIKHGEFYDYIITNDDLNEAYIKLKSIVIAERCKNLNKFKA